MTEAAPVLAVDGPWPPWTVEVSFALAWVAGCACVPALVSIGTKLVLARSGPSDTTLAIVSGAALAAFGFALWLHVVARRRAGRVEFHEDAIRFLDRPGAAPRARVPWSEVVSFSDDDADCVLIVWRRPLLALAGGAPTTDHRLRIPTPSEQARTSVLGLLDGRGLSRA